jgi:hypothetical protein
MPDTPKRRWFQFNFDTLFAYVLITAFVVWFALVFRYKPLDCIIGLVCAYLIIRGLSRGNGSGGGFQRRTRFP